MPIDLFGFSVGRTKRNNVNSMVSPEAAQANVPSFVMPEVDDAYTVDAGGYLGYGVDLDGSLRTDSQYVFKYRDMAMQPELEKAVEDICNEAIVYDEQRYPVEIVLDHVNLPDNVKDSIRKEFQYLLRLLDFNNRGYEIFRRWYIDGKGYYHMIVDPKKPKKGILEMRPVDAAKIKKIAEVIKDKDPKTGAAIVKGVKEKYVYRDKPNETSALEIAPEAICYYPSGLYDASRSRAISYLHTPERRIFYVDVGNLPKTKAEQYVRDLMNRYRNKLTYDASTGEMKDDRKFMSMLEDYWLPRREGGKGTEITTLDGGQNLGEMDDVLYFEKKLYKALDVPLSRIETDTGFNMGRASEINRDELNFQKFIGRLQNKFSMLFMNSLRVQVILKGIVSEDEFYKINQDIRFDFVSDSFFEESKEYEIIKERLDVLREMTEYIGDYYSRDYVRRAILRQTDADIKQQDKQIDTERELGLLPEKNGDGGF
jgi:hypothetical protein